MQRRIKISNARGTCTHQVRVFAQQRLEPKQITVHHSLYRRFKLKDGGMVFSDRFDILNQRKPALKVVPAGDGELSIRDFQRRFLDFRVWQIPRQPRNFGVEEAWMILMEQPDGF